MATNFAWNAEKSELLFRQRRITLEDVATAIREGQALDTVPHPNQDRYPGQQMYYVEIRGYVYAVPFVTEPDGTHFLKTAFPSRKAMRDYLGRQR